MSLPLQEQLAVALLSSLQRRRQQMDGCSTEHVGHRLQGWEQDGYRFLAIPVAFLECAPDVQCHSIAGIVWLRLGLRPSTTDWGWRATPRARCCGLRLRYARRSKVHNVAPSGACAGILQLEALV